MAASVVTQTFLPKLFTESIHTWFAIITVVIYLKGVDTEECIQVAGNQCKCVSKSNSYTIDLSPMVADLPATGGKPKFTIKDPKIATTEYSYSPCKNFTEKACINMAVCQVVTDIASSSATYYPLGTQPSAVMSGDAEAGTLRIVYQALSPSDGKIRYSYMNIKCSDAQIPSLDALGELTTLHYNFTLHTNLACVKVVNSPQDLSAGSIILIVATVLVVVYLACGVMYMRFYGGATGIEQIPNIEFWKDLPSLVKDGVSFAMSGCKVDTAYQEI